MQTTRFDQSHRQQWHRFLPAKNNALVFCAPIIYIGVKRPCSKRLLNTSGLACQVPPCMMCVHLCTVASLTDKDSHNRCDHVDHLKHRLQICKTIVQDFEFSSHYWSEMLMWLGDTHPNFPSLSSSIFLVGLCRPQGTQRLGGNSVPRFLT